MFMLFILGSVDLISTAGETMIIPAIPDILMNSILHILIHLGY
jgi:hypothetical protein